MGNLPFYAIPLASTRNAPGTGLLLLSGGDRPLMEDAQWAADLLANRLAALQYNRAQIDDRRHRRERSWLFSIINAVTDPILLTDADGRILIANAGAERLLTTEEDRSEGRRRAVALNNMLFSATLFNSGSGAASQELVLVDPSEGQELLFEVLRAPVRLRPGEPGLVSVLRNVPDLRRASEEI
jgi:PAS domain-containing protein